MNYQQTSLFEEQALNPLPSYRGVSLANRTRKRESVRRLMTSVKCGLKCGESFARLTPHGSWEKMCGDYSQASMVNSFEEYCGIFPTSGLMLDGVCFEHPMPERCTTEKDSQLLPTLPASATYLGEFKRTEWNGENKHSMTLIQALRRGRGGSMNLNPRWCEMFMGFPIGWTELTPSETR